MLKEEMARGGHSVRIMEDLLIDQPPRIYSTRAGPCHFGTGRFAIERLKYIIIGLLKSLSIVFQHRDDPQALIDCLLPRKDVCQIDLLMLWSNTEASIQLGSRLNHLGFLREQGLEMLLAFVNFSKLRLLSIYYLAYDWTTEGIVAERREEFPADLTVELGFYIG